MPASKRLRKTYRHLSDRAERGFDATRQQVRRLTEDRVCIGITGLSRSGKTTFVTSLINQLTHYDQANLSGFSPALGGQLLGCRVRPLEDRRLRPFPYSGAMAALAATPPQWPQPTEELSGCLLALKLRRGRGPLGALRGARRTLFVEIRDYPGEWLLDLPMMGLDYAQWCGQCKELYVREPRASLLGELGETLAGLDPSAPYDEGQAHALHQRYLTFLRRCKGSEHRLSLIQPGRFLIPGPDGPPLHFLPLLGQELSSRALQDADPQSYFKVFESRYQAYISEHVTPFYQEFFRPVQRQIVLVDLVNALNGGPAYVEDLRDALGRISDSFSYGRRSLLARLFSSRIEKVVFAATKVDQVVSRDHEPARRLLGSIVSQAIRNAAYEGVTPAVEAIASIRSSINIQDQGDDALAGRGPDGNLAYVHPPVPEQLHTEADYGEFRDWKIPPLQPPPGIRESGGPAIPHIRMDTVLEMLIGDLCR
ncbi:YcjX family protein [Motiliproteus sp. SC1-56]|uniref:YcjX family protein n=1 Tax=Motiliproteus sp. SC1-56 TaxID=2799565 RepID=UPI001A90A5BE|nr:YcjX family protein [Motiliproteus sp. SC1-56]